MALFKILLTPTNDPLQEVHEVHNLIVGFCLVLAPDVNLLLNSRKQGFPCWCNASFSSNLPSYGRHSYVI